MREIATSKILGCLASPWCMHTDVLFAPPRSRGLPPILEFFTHWSKSKLFKSQRFVIYWSTLQLFYFLIYYVLHFCSVFLLFITVWEFFYYWFLNGEYMLKFINAFLRNHYISIIFKYNSFFNLKKLFLFYMCEYFACKHVSALSTYLVPMEARRGSRIPWTWSSNNYKPLCVCRKANLGLLLKLNHISPSSKYFIVFIICIDSVSFFERH